MNGIVLIALRREFTFAVMAIMIPPAGMRAVLTAPAGVFSSGPAVAVPGAYNGPAPAGISGRIVFHEERAPAPAASNTRHTGSQSLYGFGVAQRVSAYLSISKA